MTAAVLFLSACGRGASQTTPQDAEIFREYGFNSDLSDPQAQWHPSRYLVVLTRLPRGLVLMHEQRKYGATTKLRMAQRPGIRSG